MITITKTRVLMLVMVLAAAAVLVAVSPLARARARVELSDDAARQVALAAVRAYFTVEPGHQATWLDSFSGFSDQATRDFLAMFVWPLLQERGVVSRAMPLEAGKVHEGVDVLTGLRWQIWRVVVNVDPPWPGDPPPALGPFAVPWASQGRVEVLVSLLQRGKERQFSLFPTEKVLEAVAQGGSEEVKP